MLASFKHIQPAAKLDYIHMMTMASTEIRKFHFRTICVDMKTIREGRREGSKIPMAPSAVRPISAHTKAASKIPSMSSDTAKTRAVGETPFSWRNGTVKAAVACTQERDMLRDPRNKLHGASDISSHQVCSPKGFTRPHSSGSGCSSDIRDSTEVGLGQLREV